MSNFSNTKFLSVVWFNRSIIAIFILSGCAGLIYQSIWAQYLGLFLGHAAYAQTLVLAIFMGGMALGAWSASRWLLTRPRLLLYYAICEMIIGVAGLLFHIFYQTSVDLIFASLIPQLEDATAITATKWLLAGALILPQSILLGMTFPLMSSALIRRGKQSQGHVLGLLYFANSLGAAGGALVATFILLPAIGLPGAMYSAGILNLLVAAVAWFLANSEKETALSSTPEIDTQKTIPANGFYRFILVAAFITGLSSFLYEIGWIRMLSLALGATIHSFELMLSAFILGLALGGFWIRKRIDSLADPVSFVGLIQVLMGLAALATLPLYTYSFDWVSWFIQALSKSEQGYVIYNVASSAIAMIIMMPATFFAGMTLPLFTYCLLERKHGEKSIGHVYAINTLGAIVGIFLAIHWLMPNLGLKMMLIIAGVLDIALGLIIMRRLSVQVKFAQYAGAFLLSAVVIGLILNFVKFDPKRLSSGVFRHGNTELTDRQMLYYRDGKTSSVSLFSIAGIVTLANNGKPDAAIQLLEDERPSVDELTMIMLGLLPMSIYPDATQYANIGWGSGLTAHTLMASPTIEKVDTIEIEPSVYVASQGFGERVERAYTDPRSRIHFDDAKTFFATQKKRYDIIISEPSNPWVTGISGLFSEEFYKFLSQHIEDDGLLVQWLHLYEIDEQLVASVFKALEKHFPYYTVYNTADIDLAIVASKTSPVPLPTNIPFEIDKLKPELSRVFLGSVRDLEMHWLGNQNTLGPLFAKSEIPANSDYYPVLSLLAPKTRFKKDTFALSLLQSSALPVLELLGAPQAHQNNFDVNTGARQNYQQKVQLGRAILAALQDENYENDNVLSGDILISLRMLIEQGKQCSYVFSDNLWMAPTHTLMISTLPVLSPTERDQLWSVLPWKNCELTDAAQKQMALYKAVSSRDARKMLTLSQELMVDDQQSKAIIWQEYLALAAGIAAIKLQDTTDMPALAEKIGSIPPANNSDQMARKVIETLLMAEQSNPANIAQH